MNIKTLKKPDQRIDTKYLSSLGIKTFDYNNLYPQHARDVVSSSSTGKSCVERYSMFIEGNGLNNQELSDFVVNRSGEIMDDIHQHVSEDMAMHRGFALHINYNVFGDIVELQHEPFENCRLEEEDDNGIVSNIIVHPDWRGKKTRSGKSIKVNTETIETIPVFNPRKEVVLDQIQKAGGIEYYKGQILWVSMSGMNNYPTSKFDSVLTEMNTDDGLSNIKNRNVKNNFLPAGMLVTKRAQSSPDISDEGSGTSQDEGYSEQLKQFQGDANAGKIMEIEVEFDEEVPTFVPFATRNTDKEFTATDQSVVERIYTAFNQEVFYCIRSGKIGFSGDLVRDAWNDYAAQVTKEQRLISRAYKKIFAHWNPIDITSNMISDFSIQSLQYGGVDSNINNN